MIDLDLHMHTISALIAKGEQACARGRPDELSIVAGMLSACVAVPEQLELDGVARDAGCDMPSACAAWKGVVDRLVRHGVGARFSSSPEDAAR